MFKILVDTCVWLDLAKDHRQEPLLTALETLCQQGEISILAPSIVLTEFAKNKMRVIEESGRSLSGTLKRAREILGHLGAGQGKQLALRHLAEVQDRIPRMGEAAVQSIGRIEKLLTNSQALEASNAIVLCAAQRAVDCLAPFHRPRNGMADAILIETYSDIVHDKASSGCRFAFVTHNTKDFSHPTDNRLPHPDIAGSFSKKKSLYMTSLAEILQKIAPQLVTDIMLETEWSPEPRTLTEMLDAIEELSNKIWYDRHQVLLEKIEKGEIEVVEKENFPITDQQRHPIQRDILDGAIKSARKVEKKYGIDNLGPWSEFEWGMINGKLSALRWVLGDDWDSLYT